MVKTVSISLSDEAFEKMERDRTRGFKINRSNYIEELIWSVQNDKLELIKKNAILRKILRTVVAENDALRKLIKEYLDEDFDPVVNTILKLSASKTNLERALKQLDGVGVKE